jgi:hypothetical protein
MARCETCGNDYDKAFQVIFFCCEHCAERAGVTGLRDRIGTAA